jgi:3-hydroxy-9,10-secoandrosta-1,3,5(10)-triene-9,17-dione monooxygenase
MELARACGSSAWCFSVWSSHNWAAGHFGDEGASEYFAEGPDTVCASSVGPGPGKAEPVDGGYRLSGHWGFSSGCDASTWELLGAMAPAGPIWTLVPRPDYTIIDNWFVSGMRGTGSKDVAVEDAFVPARRTIPLGGLGEEPYAAWELHRRPSYRLPIGCIFGWTLASPIVGLAQGAVDEFIERTAASTSRGRTAETVPVQLRLAESAAEADAARLIMRTDCQEMLARAAAEEDFPSLVRTKYNRNRAFCVKLTMRAINRLFEASGGHALFDSEPIQRIHRDAHAASHRTGLIFDLGGGDQWGKAALGLEIPRGMYG